MMHDALQSALEDEPDEDVIEEIELAIERLGRIVTEGWAEFSDDRTYRYLLGRRVSDSKRSPAVHYAEPVSRRIPQNQTLPSVNV